MALDFGSKADWFMACMAFETMETFSPKIRPIRNGKRLSSAVGLIQFLEAIAQSLGTSTDKLEGMTPEEQLKYVWLYFRDRMKERGLKTIDTLEDVYMAIHWPAAMGKPNSQVLYVYGSSAYAANSGLDTDKDHRITKAEAGALVRAKLEKGLQTEYYYAG